VLYSPSKSATEPTQNLEHRPVHLITLFHVNLALSVTHRGRCVFHMPQCCQENPAALPVTLFALQVMFVRILVARQRRALPVLLVIHKVNAATLSVSVLIPLALVLLN
jgi:hypothetical protein